MLVLFLNRRILCHVEHLSYHIGYSFDKKYPEMTLLELLPNVFYEETQFE
jgi:hypothetical protein